jgi:hypothetical protein
MMDPLTDQRVIGNGDSFYVDKPHFSLTGEDWQVPHTREK